MKALILTTLISSLTFGASFIVETKTPLDKKALKELHSISGVKEIEKFTRYSSEYFDRLYSIEADASSLNKLKMHKLVKLAEEDFEADFYEIKPNKQSKMLTKDMLFPLQWGLLNQKQIVSKKLITGNIKETHGVDGYDIDWEDGIKEIEANLKRTPVVAVVDMGVDLDHPELKDQIYKNEAECNSDGVAVGGTKEDKDQNKYPGDCYGWNFAATDPLYWQFPYDDKNHGTHIAGIIAAKKNNDLGVSGVSDKIKILPVRVTGAIDERSERDRIMMKAPSKRIANGILYAVRRGVDVINLSLGWPKTMDTNFMRKVIAEAVSKDIVVVAAAGNNNTNANIFPCAYYDVICVGSIDNNGKLSKFSNYGGEVDILAPGDQIVSTAPTAFIPLKLNINGYEILSGTSQAAPFVSATAALLKGTYPDIKIEEVMRRLYDSAMDKDDVTKSKHGNLQLSSAFKLKEAVSIKPIFKNLSEIVFNGKDGTFKLVLNFKNLGLVGENVDIKLESLNGDLLFKQNSFQLPKVESYKPFSLNFLGRLSKRDVELKTQIKVTIGSDEIGFKEYFHELSLAKNIFTSDHVRDIGFKFNDEDIPVAFIREGKVLDNLRTVDETFGDGSFPTFYVKYQDTSKKEGLKLHFFNLKADEITQEETSYEEDNALKLLSVVKGDYNYDGVSDLLIKTIVKEDGVGFVKYSYRNLDMTPLVGEFSDIKFIPEVVNVDTEKLRLKKTKLSNGMSLATPIFSAVGALPIKDQINDPWTRVDKSKVLRIYSLELIEETKSYEIRSFYNRDFIDKIKEELKELNHQTVAFEDSNLEILGFKGQSRNDYYNDLVEIYFSYGLGFYRENFKLNISDSKKTTELISLQDKVEGADIIPGLHANYVERRNTQNIFVKYLTNNKISLTLNSNTENDNFVFDLNQEDDLIQSFLSLFDTQDMYYSFFETLDNIVLSSVDKRTKEAIVSKRKTTKFSFLPGVSMNEAYYPILIEKDNKKTPALYVDGTRISGNHIYVNTIKDNKISAPAHLSIYVPDFCTTKNPTLNEDGFFRYTLICSSSKGFFIKLIDLVL